MLDSLLNIAIATPKTQVANIKFNKDEAVRLAREAEGEGAKIILFPKLNISSYTAGDLFFSTSFITECERAVSEYLKETENLEILSFIGVPVRHFGKLYAVTLAVFKGEILGAVPSDVQTEAEARYFSSLSDGFFVINYAGQDIDFSNKIIYECETLSSLRIFTESSIGFSHPFSIGAEAALAGATLILMPSAENEQIGARERLFRGLASYSERLISAVALANAGNGESTTDLVYSSNSFVFENGELLAERGAFAREEITYALCDFEKLENRRIMNTAFKSEVSCEFLYIPFKLDICESKIEKYEKSPFIPSDPSEQDRLASLAIRMQAEALAKRFIASRSKCLVLGVSGGLDSTLALLVCAEACEILGISRDKIIAVTMPCFGTTKRTKSNAVKLSLALSATVREVDIKKSVLLHFKDIGHNSDDYNAVYENAQARERTQVLMDIANELSGIVVGTGDLSELALGFATYNGDQMSMYGVNAGIPKTLLRLLVSYYAKNSTKEIARVLTDILNTPVSPELLPPKDNEISQCTENIVGPYELHDFFLYHFLKNGFAPRKIKRLASAAFSGIYDEGTVEGWLKIFLRRFISQQFKRSAMPDGVKILDISLSPRGELRLPSDANGDFLFER